MWAGAHGRAAWSSAQATDGPSGYLSTPHQGLPTVTNSEEL